MKKLMTSLNKRSGSADDVPGSAGDSPQANAARGVRLFCESGGPNSSGGQGEEVLHLPVIVEAAESSPDAAKDAAVTIRKYLSKDNNKRPYVQYNAIMLIRILSDNPGKTFTRNMDSKFIATVKELSRTSQDGSVQQILTETLDEFARKKDDPGLFPISEFWVKEKEKRQKSWNVLGAPPDTFRSPNHTQQQVLPQGHQSQNYFARSHKNKGLPAPHELAARIEEAKTSAKLLQQVVMSTPTNEILGNDLIKEFADRCQSASRSVQGYIHADNPAPDDDTLLTLIETNDQLSNAMSKHQRAVLNARKLLSPPGPTPSPPALSAASEPPKEEQNPFADPNQPPASLQAPLQPTPQAAPAPPLAPAAQHLAQSQNEFNSGFPVPPQAPSYHPGMNTTPSYVNRQQSAVANTAMRGAVAEVDQRVSPVLPEEERHPVTYRY